jgi:murein DD-endopeptidase MepM/ murein hydrolase activator NlpD
MKGELKRWNWVFLLSFFTTHASYAALLPENHSVNGGVTIIPLDIRQKPDIYYDNKKIAVIPSEKPNQWLLIVGIPLEKEEPIQNLIMTRPAKKSMPFHVSDKFYATQAITLSNQRLVDPYRQDEARIAEENKEMAALYSQFTVVDPFKEGFKAPVRGPITSVFGLKRIFNQKPRPPHLGLDIAAPEDTSVHVVTSGKVVSTKDYFFTGNTVIIDHGMGVFSLYAHLKRIDVKPGDQLKQGEQVGLVGKTGRATAPHLHWSMIINQTFVDPLLFVPSRLISIPLSKTTKTNPASKKSALNKCAETHA